MAVTELLAEQAAAGARYSAAVAELRAAWIGLAAIERALGNAHVAGRSVPTFHGDTPDLPPSRLLHPRFAPDVGARWSDEADRRRDEIVHSFTRGAAA